MDGLDSCSICMETFDDNVRPRALPCGHTFCTGCIDNAIEDGSLSCPNCKKPHHASRATDFPINYTTEALLSKLKEVQQGAVPKAASKTCSHAYDSRSLKSRARAVVNDQRDSLRSLLEMCETLKLDINNYRSFLRERKSKHKELITKISDFLHQNEDLVKHLDAEDRKFMGILKEVEEHQKMAKMSASESITETTDLEITSEELEKLYDTLDDWYHKCNTQMPCAETIKRSSKIVKEITAALCLLGKEEDNTASTSVDLSDSGLSLMDKLSLLQESPLTVTSLKTMTATTKILLESGKIYAVQKKEGHVRSAKITTRDGNTYLHSLEDKEPPASVFTIELTDLMGTLESDSILTFLDLAWDGKIRGRIHILLSPDTPFARHFKSLCIGDFGPTYMGTTFLEVRNKGNVQFEGIKAGDYENGDGSGGAPLFKGLNTQDSVYTRTYDKGSVHAVHHAIDGYTSAQFSIVVGTGTGRNAGGIFGQVQDGLELAKEAIKQDDIRSVVIQDCGVVLPV